jgi:hypothetical protein
MTPILSIGCTDNKEKKCHDVPCSEEPGQSLHPSAFGHRTDGDAMAAKNVLPTLSASPGNGMFKDFVFLCPSSNEVEPISHAHYLELVHRQKVLPEYTGRQIRLAIFYVAMENGQPVKAVNATYGLLDVDDEGFVSPHSGGFSLEQNRAFWKAVENSPYKDVDYDPQVQKARRAMHDEFSWVPSEKEQRMMLDQIFDGNAALS